MSQAKDERCRICKASDKEDNQLVGEVQKLGEVRLKVIWNMTLFNLCWR